MEILAVFLLFVLSISNGFPAQDNENFNLTTVTSYRNNSSFAGDLSHMIALNLLKWNNDIDSNQVHSPLGVATLLAILAEASSDKGYTEFVNFLGYPKERFYLRESFGRILADYSSNNPGLKPYFKTWFYIYKNQTARTEFKDLLRTKYFVEVKDIDRNELEVNSEEVDSLDAALETTTKSNSKDVIDFDLIKRLKSANSNDDRESSNNSNIKDSYGTEVIDKVASKFDRNVNDNQYVEDPTTYKEDLQKSNSTADVTIDYVKKNNSTKVLEARSRKDENDVNLLENETVRDEEKIEMLHKRYGTKQEKHSGPQKLFTSNEPQKISLPLQKFEDFFGGVDILEAFRSHLRLVRARTLFRKDDISSSFSANSVTSRDNNSKTKMLIFNGMYYCGSWAYPFQEIKSNPDEEETFHLTNDNKMKITMMEGHGMYSIADLEHLNTKVISIPYQNQRFSLIILLPNEIEGLYSLLKNIQSNDLDSMFDHLKEKEIFVRLPKFTVEQTSRSDEMLKNMKLQSLFSNDKSDLTLMTADRNVRIDQLVQFVNVRIDETGSSENSLTASNTEGRTAPTKMTMKAATKEDIFYINRPFAYFIFDKIENFALVSGKIMAPEFKKDEIQVDLEQS